MDVSWLTIGSSFQENSLQVSGEFKDTKVTKQREESRHQKNKHKDKHKDNHKNKHNDRHKDKFNDEYHLELERDLDQQRKRERHISQLTCDYSIDRKGNKDNEFGWDIPSYPSVTHIKHTLPSGAIVRHAKASIFAISNRISIAQRMKEREVAMAKDKRYFSSSSNYLIGEKRHLVKSIRRNVLSIGSISMEYLPLTSSDLDEEVNIEKEDIQLALKQVEDITKRIQELEAYTSWILSDHSNVDLLQLLPNIIKTLMLEIPLLQSQHKTSNFSATSKTNDFAYLCSRLIIKLDKILKEFHLYFSKSRREGMSSLVIETYETLVHLLVEYNLMITIDKTSEDNYIQRLQQLIDDKFISKSFRFKLILRLWKFESKNLSTGKGKSLVNKFLHQHFNKKAHCIEYELFVVRMMFSMIQMEQRAGFMERSIALIQVFGDFIVSSSKGNLNDFRLYGSYWESEAPRFGEYVDGKDGIGGFDRWLRHQTIGLKEYKDMLSQLQYRQVVWDSIPMTIQQHQSNDSSFNVENVQTSIEGDFEDAEVDFVYSTVHGYRIPIRKSITNSKPRSQLQSSNTNTDTNTNKQMNTIAFDIKSSQSKFAAETFASSCHFQPLRLLSEDCLSCAEQDKAMENPFRCVLQEDIQFMDSLIMKDEANYIGLVKSKEAMDSLMEVLLLLLGCRWVANNKLTSTSCICGDSICNIVPSNSAENLLFRELDDLCSNEMRDSITRRFLRGQVSWDKFLLDSEVLVLRPFECFVSIELEESHLSMQKLGNVDGFRMTRLNFLIGFVWQFISSSESIVLSHSLHSQLICTFVFLLKRRFEIEETNQTHQTISRDEVLRLMQRALERSNEEDILQVLPAWELYFSFNGISPKTRKMCDKLLLGIRSKVGINGFWGIVCDVLRSPFSQSLSTSDVLAIISYSVLDGRDNSTTIGSIFYNPKSLSSEEVSRAIEAFEDIIDEILDKGVNDSTTCDVEGLVKAIFCYSRLQMLRNIDDEEAIELAFHLVDDMFSHVIAKVSDLKLEHEVDFSSISLTYSLRKDAIFLSPSIHRMLTSLTLTRLDFLAWSISKFAFLQRQLHVHKLGVRMILRILDCSNTPDIRLLLSLWALEHQAVGGYSRLRCVCRDHLKGLHSFSVQPAIDAHRFIHGMSLSERCFGLFVNTSFHQKNSFTRDDCVIVLRDSLSNILLNSKTSREFLLEFSNLSHDSSIVLWQLLLRVLRQTMNTSLMNQSRSQLRSRLVSTFYQCIIKYTKTKSLWQQVLFISENVDKVARDVGVYIRTGATVQ